MRTRAARREDIGPAADLFRRSFEKSVRHYCGKRVPSPRVFVDLFGFLALAEPSGFRVAELDGRIIGYLVAVSSLWRLVRASATSPYLARAAFSVLSGAYGLSPASVGRLFLDKVRVGLSRKSGLTGSGQILSLAVAPEVRRQGVARRLMAATLRWLLDKRVRRVRLEVRAENVAALRLYESMGFTVEGRVNDSQGPWLLMVRELTGAGSGQLKVTPPHETCIDGEESQG